MKKEEFIKLLAEFCEFKDQKIEASTRFASIEGFNSMSILLMLAFIDENFNMRITAKQIYDLTDLNSLISLIGEEKFHDD
jgi:acyl carrier protein